MQDKPKHYYRYQMTYPYESNKVYRSRSLNKVAKKCSDEFKKYDDMGEGMFCITNLDKNVEYRFKIKNNKILAAKKINQLGTATTKQQGAGVNDDKLKAQVKEIGSFAGEEGDVDDTGIGEMFAQKITEHDARMKAQLSQHDQAVKQILGTIDTKIKSIPQPQPPKITAAKPESPKSEEMEDLFEGIDPYDLNLKKLMIRQSMNTQKMKNTNNGYENLCIIL